MDVKKLWEKYRPMALYLIFGALTTAVNIVSYTLLYQAAGVPNVPSNIIAWVLSVAVAFVTNKVWVFDSKSFAPSVALPELWKFAGCRVGTGLLDLAVMWVGVDLLHGPATAIKIASNVAVIVLNYVFSKWFIFQPRDPDS